MAFAAERRADGIFLQLLGAKRSTVKNVWRRHWRNIGSNSRLYRRTDIHASAVAGIQLYRRRSGTVSWPAYQYVEMARGKGDEDMRELSERGGVRQSKKKTEYWKHSVLPDRIELYSTQRMAPKRAPKVFAFVEICWNILGNIRCVYNLEASLLACFGILAIEHSIAAE